MTTRSDYRPSLFGAFHLACRPGSLLDCLVLSGVRSGAKPKTSVIECNRPSSAQLTLPQGNL